MPSQTAIKLTQIRNSPKMQQFLCDVLLFLDSTNASQDIRYHLTRDLAKRMDLPFYESPYKCGKRNRMGADQIVKEYCGLCVTYCNQDPNNIGFIKELLQLLSVQQNQHMRKLSPRTSNQKNKRAKMKNLKKTDVWEHPIPLKYTRKILVDYIVAGNIIEIENYIKFLTKNTYQVFLVEEWNRQLNAIGLKDTMPQGWSWKTGNVFQRYVEAGIPPSEYQP